MKHSYDKLYLSVVSVPASVQFSGLIVGSLVSAPATRAVYQIAGHIFCPAPWQLAKLIFKMLVSAPAAGAVQQIDRRIPGFSASHLCSLLGWWLDPWPLPLPPAFYQIVSNLLPLRLRPGSWPGRFSKCWRQRIDCQIPGLCACHPCSLRDRLQFVFASAPGTLQLTRLILKMMVPAPATGGVQWVDCRIPGLPASGAILWEWWLDQVASLFSAPATRAIDRIDFQTVGLCACPRCSLPSSF